MTTPVNPFVRVITRGSLGAIALVALAVLPAAVCGQSIGIKGGWSYGDVSNSGVLPGAASDRSGFAIGVGALTSNTVGLGIEALYAQRGVSSSVFGDSRRLDYFDVPVYLRVAVPTPLISPFVYAGPQGSFELQCGAGGGDCPSSGRPKVSYSGVIGGGVRLGAVGGLSVEGRYIYGLTDLKLSTVSTSESYKTRSFLIMLGIGF